MIKKYSFKNANADLPSRQRRDNKSNGGKCLIVAGSPGQWGAGILCAQAAARCGAGYTYVYDPDSSFPVGHNPDFLTLRTLKNLSQFDAVAIGPGFKNHRSIRNLIRQLIKYPQINVVLDAEAINTLAQLKNKFKLPAHWIMTPHEGELSRLLKIASPKIRAQRLKYVRQAQKIWGVVVILKGYQTLITDSNSVWEVTSGNPALAKAGTGDVLTGMIAALLSQKLSSQKAACLAAFTHGLIADQWVKSKKDHLSLLASDVVERIPDTLNTLRHKKLRT